MLKSDFLIGLQSAGGIIKPAKWWKVVGLQETGRDRDSGTLHEKAWLGPTP